MKRLLPNDRRRIGSQVKVKRPPNVARDRPRDIDRAEVTMHLRTIMLSAVAYSICNEPTCHRDRRGFERQVFSAAMLYARHGNIRFEEAAGVVDLEQLPHFSAEGILVGSNVVVGVISFAIPVPDKSPGG